MKWCRYEIGDALEVLKRQPDGVFNCCVTSPPYWGLRDYGADGQLGLEETPEAYVAALVEVFREVRRTLRDDGTLWLNLGDSYVGSNKGPEGGISVGKTHREVPGRIVASGLKPKDLVGIPWRVAFALQADGWYLRSDIIWSKPNPMPESVTDRPTKAHEYIFLLSKRATYYYDADAIREMGNPEGSHSRGAVTRIEGRKDNGRGIMPTPTAGRNKRSVWTVTAQPYGEAHFATFPPALIQPCILAGCPDSGVVLDPFLGSGTTARVAEDLGRNWFGVELNPEYAALIDRRMVQMGLIP